MKTLKRLSAFVLCFSVLLVSVMFFTPSERAEAARTIMDVESELNQYKSLLSQAQAELKDITAKLAEIDSKTNITAEVLQKYQEEIEALDVEIAINEAIMQSYDLKRGEVAAKIAVARESYDANVAMYKNLMQYIHENGDMNTFELLFSSKNITDYLTKKDNYNAIMESANQMIKQIKLSLEDLNALEVELREAQEQYNTYLSDLNFKKIEKEEKVRNFEEIAATLGKTGDELSEEYKNKNAKITEIKTKINSLTKELQALYNSTAAFIWPVKTSAYTVTSQYGYRNDPFGKPTKEYHKGIDIACAKGTPIMACKSGTVTFSGFAEYGSGYGGYGYCVIIYHGNGISTLYGHCDSIASNIKKGVTVKAGDVIGYVGTTGRSTGNHLHLGVIDTNTYTAIAGNYVNPNKYLPDGYYKKLS